MTRESGGFTPELVEVAQADRELYKFILDAPFATCSQINNMPDDAPELQQIAKHRLEASGIAEIVTAVRRLREHPQSPAAQQWVDDLLAKYGGTNG